MPWARASSLDRHLVCPAASHLPRLDRGKWEPGYLIPANHLFVAPVVEVDERSTDAADWGTALHAAKANADDAQDPWLSMMGPYREKLWPADLGMHEVTVSYDCRTKRVDLFHSPSEEARTRWKMATSPDCVVGTADWWAETPAGEPWVDDLKSGWAAQDPMSPAMQFYLMCRVKAARSCGYTGNHGWSSITHWPRKQGKLDEETGEVDAGYPSRDGLWRKVPQIILDAFEEELHWAWVRTTGTNTEARPGAHCLYCPSIPVCDKANA